MSHAKKSLWLSSCWKIKWKWKWKWDEMGKWNEWRSSKARQWERRKESSSGGRGRESERVLQLAEFLAAWSEFGWAKQNMASIFDLPEVWSCPLSLSPLHFSLYCLFSTTLSLFPPLSPFPLLLLCISLRTPNIIGSFIKYSFLAQVQNNCCYSRD